MKILLPLFCAAAVFGADAPPAPSIEKLDPALDALVAGDAKIEKVGTGYGWAEGPVWFKDRFVFSDVPKNVAYAWKRGDVEPAVFLKPSGTDEPSDLQGSNGLAVAGANSTSTSRSSATGSPSGWPRPRRRRTRGGTSNTTSPTATTPRSSGARSRRSS
jgi:sugar lactone lactonase YvrE